MAKRKVNKTGLIRDYLASNKDATAKEVFAHLKKQKVQATPNYVSNIISKLRANGNAKPKKRGRPAGAKAKKATEAPKVQRGRKAASSAIVQLLAAKKFVDSVGGFDKAQESISALKKLV